MSYISSTIINIGTERNDGQFIADVNKPETTEELSLFLRGSPESTSNRLIILQFPSVSSPPLPEQMQHTSMPNFIESEISSVLQSTLQIPHTLLLSHRDAGNNPFRFTSHFSTPRLPTESGFLSKTEGSITLPYYELRRYQPKDWNLQRFINDFRDPLTEEFELVCSATGRQIQIHESADPADGPLMVIPRKLTYWWRVRPEGGWDAICLTDPPVNDVYFEPSCSSTKSLQPNHPAAGGDIFDFIPKNHRRGDATPPRLSMMDDLTFYILTYPWLCKPTREPLDALFLFAKLITSNYAAVLGFLRFQISSMGSRGWSISQHNKASLQEFQLVKRDWLRFRCIPIRQDLEEVFDILCIPRGNGFAAEECRHWTDWKYDLQWLRVQLADCSEKYQGLTNDISALSGMITSMQSAEEAKQSSLLTTMALIFLPMSLVANILTLNSPFQPGDSLFWVYFAIAIPLTLVSFVCVMGFRAYSVHEDDDSLIKRARRSLSWKRAVSNPREDMETGNSGGEAGTRML